MKKILFVILVSASIFACTEKKESDAGLDNYKKNVEVAKQFLEVFSTKDSTKEASLLSDDFKWNGPAVGQDSLPKSALLASDKEMMKAFNDIKLTNIEYVPGVDPVTYKLDGNVRVYGTWVSKSAASGKTVKLKYYAVFTINPSGKISSLEEYTNMEDLKKEY